MYPFLYKVKFFVKKETRPVEKQQCGIVYAKSWGEAAQRLEGWYGDEQLTEINYLFPLCDDPIILPSEIVDKIAKDEYAEYYEREEISNE